MGQGQGLFLQSYCNIFTCLFSVLEVNINFQALENAKKSLQVLYCIIELTMSGGPKITRLIPFDNSHVEKLKERQ